MKKQISAFLLSVVLCLTMICPAFAAEGEGPQIKVEVSGKNVIVSSEEITDANAYYQLAYCSTTDPNWKSIPGLYTLGDPAVGAVNSIDKNGITADSDFTIRAIVSYSGKIAYGYWPDDIAVTSVSLNETTLSLNVEESKTLVATVLPENATNKNVTWTSSDESVATVDKDGNVTAVKAGEAIITATSAADSTKFATCTVTVKGTDPTPEVTVEVTPTECKLKEEETQQLTVTVSNTDEKGVTWTSSDPSVATVSSTGLVTAVKEGTATITATSLADSTKSAICTVTVSAAGTTVVSVTGVTLNKQTLSLNVNETETLYATVAPSNATNKSVNWKSDNEAVASVDATGKVTAKAVGTATITVTTEDGNKTANCEVKVSTPGTNVPVTGVTLNKETLSLNVGVSDTLVATVAPGNATNKNVTWKSDNPSVATVDETTGKVTAKAVGTATITATTVDGGKTATCEVTVTSTSTPVVPVTGVTLNRSTLPLNVGGTGTLSATVAPTNASNKDVTWKSSNENVASVDATGKVTAKAVGTATITVTTVDGGKTAACTVTVSDPGTTYPGGSTTVARPGESGGNVASNVSVSAPASVTGGSVTISDPNAKQGSTVTLTVSPRTGYELDHITVKDSAGKEVSLTSRGNGVYAFTMPAGKVSVDYSFNKTSNKPDIVNGKATFDDVPAGAWYEEAVQYAYQHGIMNGIGDNKFSPDTNLTRAMIVQVLYNLEGKPTAPQGDFEDVPADKWYADPINWAASKGIVNGYGDGNFGPEDNITREQLAAILYRYAEFKKYDVSQKGDLSKFSDAASVSEWFTEAMEWAVGAGLIQGTNEGLLMPKSTATRAQVATVMQRFCEDVID